MALTIKMLIFLIFIFSVLAIIVQNPIHGILSLICVFVLSAVILISVEVEFLALVLLIVYAGAISTLFIFIILLLNINEFPIRGFTALNYSPLSILLTAKLFSWFFFFKKIYVSPTILEPENFNVEGTMLHQIGTLLYGELNILLIGVGGLLLIAMMGALVLTKKNIGQIV